MSNYGVLIGRIDKLRNIDKLIDISKSTIQIEILLTLSRSDMTSAEIAKVTCQRRKAITDAMRKLRMKGLVDEVMEGETSKSVKYTLTSSGRNCLNMLLNLTHSNNDMKALDSTVGTHIRMNDSWLKGNVPAPNQHVIPTSVLNTVDASTFPIAAVTSEIVMALGSEKGNAMSCKRLAQILGLSEQRVESYLEVYLNGTPKLFRQYMEYPRWVRVLSKLGLKIRQKKMQSFYGLTSEGLQYFYRLPSYSKLKHSLSYRILSMLTKTTHPRVMLKRLTIMLCIGGALSIGSLLIPFGYITTSVWLFTTVFIGSIMMLDVFLYNSI